MFKFTLDDLDFPLVMICRIFASLWLLKNISSKTEIWKLRSTACCDIVVESQTERYLTANTFTDTKGHRFGNPDKNGETELVKDKTNTLLTHFML